MDPLELTLTAQLQAFATSLAIGLLMGLERERRRKSKAGLRTFALVALLGTLTGLLAQQFGSGWVVGVGLITIGVMMIVANAVNPKKDDSGTTSVVALMCNYCLGVIVWFGYPIAAVTLGITVTALLYFKTELHAFTNSLTRTDLISILQFALLSFVILPILPDRDFGPYGAFNLHHLWWMVVLISGMSLAGYTALRFIGMRKGAALIGFMGGLVSSTATTLVFARHANMHIKLEQSAALVILIASLMVILRLEILTAVVALEIVLPLMLVVGSGFCCGLLVIGWIWHNEKMEDELPIPVFSNPTEIRTALFFGLLYSLVYFLVLWLDDIAGRNSIYPVAFASGLFDVDAITLSTLRLYNLDKLDTAATVLSIALAILANLAFKAGVVIFIGGRALARRTLPGLVAIGSGILIALFLTS